MGAPQNKNLRAFPRTLTISDFGITANVNVINGTFNRVGTFTVGAQQEATFGISTLRSGGVEGEPVYLYFQASEASAVIDGVVRLRITNAQGTRQVDVMENTTQRLRADPDDRTKAVLLTEYPLNALEDSKLCVDFKPDGTAGTVRIFGYDATLSRWSIPVTIYQ